MPDKNNEYNEMEKEYKFARQFWHPAVLPEWRAVKILIGLLACIGLCYIIAQTLYISPLVAVIGVLLFIGALLAISPALRQGLVRRLLHRSYEQVRPITAYHDLAFYFLNGHDDVLFLENGRDLTAMGFFKLKAIPLIIKGNFERFIRSLYQQQIPVYWTYVQSPIDQGALLGSQFSDIVSEELIAHQQEDPDHTTRFIDNIENNNGVWGVRLLLGTRRSISSLFNAEANRLTLYQQLKADLFKISTAFTSAYPHTILELLHGKELEKAFSITVTGGGLPSFF